MKCQRTGCERDAKWYPVLVIYSPRDAYPNAEPGRMLVNVKICTECRGHVSVSDFLAGERWNKILGLFVSRGAVMPRREEVELEYTLLDSEEARLFQRMMQ